MRLSTKLHLLAALTLAAGSFSCASRLQSQPPAEKWTTGYWFWQGSEFSGEQPSEPLDALYVHVGQFGRAEGYEARQAKTPEALWHAYGKLPREVPDARAHWLVFRMEQQGVPDSAVIGHLNGLLTQLRGAALQRHWPLRGVQLDIDCPTNSLPQYAAFLKELRKALPNDLEISITGLLDWFRPGTAIADVIREVDEFVPQFYDVGMSGGLAEHAESIAQPVDAARWGPQFNRFGKRYRIGISTFGRSNVQSTSPLLNFLFFQDVKQIDLAANPALRMEAKQTPAKEIVVTYQARRVTKVGELQLSPNDTLAYVIPTLDAVRTAVAEARKMGGYAAGVVFFRWPSEEELSALNPDDVLRTASGSALAKARTTVHVQDGACATVSCADVYLDFLGTPSGQASELLLESSSELEYFVPDRPALVRMDGPKQLRVSLPPFCDQGRILLGRAVSTEPSEFHLGAAN